MREAACCSVSTPWPGGLDAEHRDRGIVEEGVEQAHGIGAAADRGDQRIRQPALGLLHLRLGLLADHRLEVAHHHRIGVRAGDGADAVVGVLDIGDPVAQRLVHRILQRRGAGGDRDHLGAEQLHAEDVGLLPLDVGRAHEDGAGQVEQGAGGRRRHAVLAGAGLGDDAGLAHAPGQQDLAEHGVDLVGAGVVQLVALEIDLGAEVGVLGLGAQVLGQPPGVPERAGAADVVLQQPAPFGVEGRVRLGRCHRPARPRGSAASASRRRNGRRIGRSGHECPGPGGRNWAAACSAAFPWGLSPDLAAVIEQPAARGKAARPRRPAHGGDEGGDPRRVLHPPRPLDAGGDIHPRRAGLADGLGHRLRRQPAGQQPGARDGAAGGQAPVEGARRCRRAGRRPAAAWRPAGSGRPSACRRPGPPGRAGRRPRPPSSPAGRSGRGWRRSGPGFPPHGAGSSRAAGRPAPPPARHRSGRRRARPAAARRWTRAERAAASAAVTARGEGG